MCFHTPKKEGFDQLLALWRRVPEVMAIPAFYRGDRDMVRGVYDPATPFIPTVSFLSYKVECLH